MPDILGARMMGGGFGGCTLNLIKKSALLKLVDEIQLAYKERFGIDLEVYKVAISDGTHLYKQN
jgi:galactokinase